LICFDADAQDELMRLTAGDSLSVQGVARISVFQDKHGEHRASLDMTANRVLALRQPKPAKADSSNERSAKSKPRKVAAPPMQHEPVWADELTGTVLE